jgi:hypothetical protein
MSDVRGVNTGAGISPLKQPVDGTVGKVSPFSTDPTEANPPSGPPGPLGQPTGVPLPVPPGQARILSDVSAGRDPSQAAAAELLRETGGVSATDKLLGLDLQPSVLGAFFAPPGNSEALRHMSPTMRRTAMRNLLHKQRERMGRLESWLRRERDEEADRERQRDPESPQEELMELESQRERALGELNTAAQMLDLLQELLAMQDYTISQMGTFSKG